MTPKDEFLSRLQSAFESEAQEHLQAIAAGLLDLEKKPDDERRRELIASIFREAHSLKGAARAVNRPEIEVICQSLESVFSLWKRDDVAPAPDLLDPLHDAVNGIAKLLTSFDSPAAGLGKDEISMLLAHLGVLAGERPLETPRDEAREKTRQTSVPDPTRPTAAQPPPETVLETSPPAESPQPAAGTIQRRPPPSKPAPSDTIRISAAKLDAMLLKAEEFLTVKLTINQQALELRALAATLDEWEKDWRKTSAYLHMLWSPRSDAAPTPEASPHVADRNTSLFPAGAKLAEFLDWNHTLVHSVQERVHALAKAGDQERRVTGAMVDALLEDAKKLMMLPSSTLLAVIPKLVRDLARDEGKEVDLAIQGGEVEIDKRILEEMKDPLIHLVRNCVDHGIELPAKRVEARKPRRGTIEIRVSQVEGNKVEMLISDDGAGINADAVRTAAVRHGIVSSEHAQKLNDEEAIRLIFEPEVSTSPMITEISGRGLGLAIVKEKVEHLGGQIKVDTRANAGTTFRLLLPLALATFRGILARAGGQTFVIPTASVDRVARVRTDDIKTIENRETIRLDDRTLSFVRLSDALQLPRIAGKEDGVYVSVVVLGAGDTRIAFWVDAVLNEQEVLVKPLGKPLSRVRNIAGATILGSGKAVAILNVTDLMRSATNWKGAPAASQEAGNSASMSRKSVLVVEDSITARMLIKNILESAGYSVKTAVDGVDAFAILRSEKVDLVVSDVEMPRMNGFDLTAKIRADQRLTDLPVVLVTALASQEDRERGVDVGASAYIVKSNFEQSNLLDVLRQLA